MKRQFPALQHSPERLSITYDSKLKPFVAVVTWEPVGGEFKSSD